MDVVGVWLWVCVPGEVEVYRLLEECGREGAGARAFQGFVVGSVQMISNGSSGY